MFTDYGGLTQEAHKEWCDASKEGTGLGGTILEHIEKNKIEIPKEEVFYGRDRAGFPHLLLKRAFVRKLLRKPRAVMTDAEKAEKKKDRAEREAVKEHANLVSICVKRIMGLKTEIDPMDGLRSVVMACLESSGMEDEEVESLGFGAKTISDMIVKAAKTKSPADLVKIVIALDVSRMSRERHSRSFELACEAFGLNIDDVVEELGRAAEAEHRKKRSGGS